jgi:hypothetical protein
MEKKEYSFKCGLKASQRELTLRQDRKLFDIFKKSDIESIESLNIRELGDFLFEKNMAVEFFKIILKPSDGEVTEELINEFHNSEMEEVLSDFFTLNPKVLTWLGTLGSVADTLMKNPASQSSEKSGDNISQTS